MKRMGAETCSDNFHKGEKIPNNPVFVENMTDIKYLKLL